MNMQGKRIFFDAIDGRVIEVVPEAFGTFTPRSIDEDIQLYSTLKNRERTSLGVIELDYGQYAQDFSEGVLDHVDPETKQLYFRYPDPSNSDPEPEPRPPLSVEVDALKQADIENKQAIAELTMMIAAPMV